MLVIPEEPEINHIVVIVDVHKEKVYDVHRYDDVYVLRKSAAGRWTGSNPGASLEYRAEVDASCSDRIGIAIKDECEREWCRAVVTRTRRDAPLSFFGIDSHNKHSVTVLVLDDSEKDALPFENGERAYLVIRSEGATVLRQSAPSDSEGLKAYELSWGSALESKKVGVTVRREESGIRVTWPDCEACLWNVNDNWVGVCREWKRGRRGNKCNIRQRLIWMMPDPFWPPSTLIFS